MRQALAQFHPLPPPPLLRVPTSINKPGTNGRFETISNHDSAAGIRFNPPRGNSIGHPLTRFRFKYQGLILSRHKSRGYIDNTCGNVPSSRGHAADYNYVKYTAALPAVCTRGISRSD